MNVFRVRIIHNSFLMFLYDILLLGEVQELFKCIHVSLISQIEESLPLKLNFLLASFEGVGWIAIIVQMEVISHSSILRCRHRMATSVRDLLRLRFRAEAHFFLGYWTLNMKRPHISLLLQNALVRIIFHYFSTRLLQIAGQIT